MYSDWTDGTYYRVVVTDALIDIAETSWLISNYPTFEIYDIYYADYSVGSPAIISFGAYDYYVTSASGSPGQVAAATGGYAGAVAFNGSPGTEVQLSAYTSDVQCTTGATTYIHPPSIFPEFGVTDVQGSCSNAATGSVSFAIFNGTTYGGLQLRLKSLSGQWVPGFQNINSIPATRVLSNVPAGTYWAVLYGQNGWSFPGLPYTHMDSILVTVPDNGPTCGMVQGVAFMDYNLDCTKQANEPGVPELILKVMPGPHYTTTSSTGTYSLVLPVGEYTIEQQSDLVGAHCVDEPVPFTLTGAATPVTVNFADTASVPLDVSISMSSGIARPGFEFNYGFTIKNLTPANSGVITVTMEFDPVLQFENANPEPTSVSGNTIIWEQSALSGWQQRIFTVNFLVPPDVGLLGTDLVTTATVTTANTDGNLANNTATNTRTVTGAYDPNDKLAWTSSGSTTEFVPASDDWIDYTIRFQNTGTDTAFNVIITDTLIASLDPGSIQIGAASHPFTWQLSGHGTLKFYFLNIQLPDSNVNEPLSHGFVSFRIRPHDTQDLQPGDQLVNIANIYFDFNPPVITDPSVLVVPVPQVVLNAKVFLGGTYAGGMNGDALRAQGLIPLAEPYSMLDYPFNGGGGESAQAAVFNTTGVNAIVDWVVVEIRSSAQPATVIFSRSALLQRDGDVVDLNGVSPVSLSIPAGSYHVAIRHRNHAVVMTATAQSLSMNSPLIDFTNSTTTTWGTDARKNINGTMVLWPGDVNFDGVVKYSGAGNDRDIVLQVIGGNVPSNTVNNVYDPADVNLDGMVKYTGADNDRDLILQTIGGVVPTAVKVGQVP